MLSRRFFSTELPLKLYSLEGRYASALFMAAAKNNELAKVETDINKISRVISNSPNLQSFLLDPTLGRDRKSQTVKELLKGDGNNGYSKAVVNFFSVMAENGRLSLTKKIISAFDELIKAHRGEIDVQITSFKELPKETLDKLKDSITKQFAIQGKVLKLSTKIDPAILGGLVVQVGDKTIDMSVVSRLSQVKKALESN